MNRPRLTALIPTRDEEKNLPDCLASVAGWVDEIVVVDSLSTDRTADIARDVGARVLERLFDTLPRQKNWALERVGGDWVLALDADERVTPELRAEIAALFAEGDPAADAYEVGRINYFFGLRARGGGVGRDRIVRLFRRRLRFTDVMVHERLDTAGARVGRLRGALTHFSTWSIDACCAKQHAYARLRAREERAKGRRGAGLFSMMLRPAWRFFRMYALQGGFLMGRLGFVMAAFNAMGVFERYARLWAGEVVPTDRNGEDA